MNEEIFGWIRDIAIVIVTASLIYRYYRNSSKNIRDKYDTFWPRFFAYYIDSVILLLILTGSSILLAPFQKPVALILVLFFVMYTGRNIYTIYFHGKYGQTFGKMMCKIKVVRVTAEEDITFRHSVMRNSVPLLIVVTFLVCEYGPYLVSLDSPPAYLQIYPGSFMIWAAWFLAEVITISANNKRRAIYDYIAGTVVIRTNIQEDIPESQEADVQ